MKCSIISSARRLPTSLLTLCTCPMPSQERWMPPVPSQGVLSLARAGVHSLERDARLESAGSRDLLYWRASFQRAVTVDASAEVDGCG